MSRKNILLLFASFLIIIFSGGCLSVGPDFQTPEAPVAKHWEDVDDGKIEGADSIIEADDTSDSDQFVRPEPADYNEWWKVFNDQTLNKLIETAYSQNLSLQIAGLRVLQARAQLGIAEGEIFPQTQELRAYYNHQKLSHPEPWESRYFNETGLGFDASWEVDFWGKFRRGIQSADSSLFANIASYDDMLVTLTAEVARIYIEIRTLEERIQLTQENVSIQNQGVELALARFEGGVATELDVQQAETILWTTMALIPKLQISLRQAQNSLSILLGIPPEDLGNYLSGYGPIPRAPDEVAVGIPADLLRRRPDIKQAEFEAAAQCYRVGIAKSELYPSFFIAGSIGWDGTDSGGSELKDTFDSNNLGYTIGPLVKWKFLNYGRLENRVRVQDAIFEQYLTNYRNIVLNAAREVEDAITGFQRSEIKARYLQESVKTAKRSTDISLIQYKEGIVTYQPVLDALTSLSEQQDQYVQTKGDIVYNLVSLYKSLGGGWELSLGNSFISADVRERMEKRTGWGSMLEISNEELKTDIE